MSSQVSVTTGQPLTGWVPALAASLPGSRHYVTAKFVLYCEDPTNTAEPIFEACEELSSGNPVHAELVEKDAAIPCGPGEQKTYVIRKCPYAYVRLSARGQPPGFSATLVRGGIEIIQ